MKKVCELSYQFAIKAIESTKQVYFKSGVWNNYKLVDTQYAIGRIKKSKYGADIYLDEKTGMYHVCCPVGSDMW
jgi:hypothetical protein